MAFMFRVILILTARFLSVLEGAPVLTVDDNPSIYSSVATLKCSDASYTAGSGYRWTKDGVTVFNNAGEISTSGKYSEEIDGTTFKLIIDNLVVDDEGSYSCSYAFQDSNTLNLEIESRGKVTAELSKGKLEVTFSEIYPSTIIVVVTCGTKQVNGAFITNDTNGDRFDRKWESTTLLVADDVKSGCSATATLRSAFTIGFTVSTVPPPPFPPWKIVVIVIVILYFVGVLIGIVKCLLQSKKLCECCEEKLCDWLGKGNELNWWVVIPLCVIIVGLGIITVWLIWRLCCSGEGNGDVEPRVRTPRNETQSGNPHTDQKKSETKKNKSKDSVAHTANEQHNQGRKQPPPPSDAGTAAGTTLNGREDSDGAVSREHVDLQESGRTLKQRPMPDIPRKTERQGHDSKGRGLSANFNDDDHPLIGVDIPIQKAGALEALPEGTGGDGSVKKLKKKKKKSKDQEDEV